MTVIKNNCQLNSDNYHLLIINNSTITNNICDTIIPLSNVMNQTTNYIDVDKEIYTQQNDLQLIYLFIYLLVII